MLPGWLSRHSVLMTSTSQPREIHYVLGNWLLGLPCSMTTGERMPAWV